MKIMNRQELIATLKKKHLYIYGTGHIANHFYIGLHESGISDNVVGFIETEPKTVSQNGLKIISIDNYVNKENDLICVAVHESNMKDICKNLKSKKIYNYIWVEPFVSTLVYGMPILENVQVKVTDIVSKQVGYSIAIRDLAIDEFLGKNNYGYNIYKKSFSYFGNDQTANHRLNQFQEVITSWMENGYDKKSVIALDKDYNLLEGAHRVTLAYHFGQVSLNTKIYNRISNYFQYMGKSILKDTDELKMAGMTTNEIKTLVDRKREIDALVKNECDT